MHRLIVDRKLRWDALRAQGADLLLFSALVVVGLSYGLGYRLDWSEATGRPEDDQEVAEVPAPAAATAGTSRVEALPAAPAPPAAAPPPVVAAPPVATMSAAPAPEMRPDP